MNIYFTTGTIQIQSKDGKQRIYRDIITIEQLEKIIL